MHLKKVTIYNYKCFELLELQPSNKINVLIGRNNSGKSTLLKAIFSLQDTYYLSGDKRYIGAKTGMGIKYELFEQPMYSSEVTLPGLSASEIASATRSGYFPNGIQLYEPNNLFYPFWSNRKVSNYEQQVNSGNETSITGNLQNLTSKIDKVKDIEFHGNTIFENACMEALGFRITTRSTPNGKDIFYSTEHQQNIPLKEMGDGVASILGLLCDLCSARNNVFLIEELENDLHPQALNVLLDVIIESSKINQIFISTHSNIVLKRLGSVQETKIFLLKNDSISVGSRLRLTNVTELKSVEERGDALIELGYEFNDIMMHDTWFLFEESSAETLFRFLINYFFPELALKIKTISARGYKDLFKKYTVLSDLYLFTHLEKIPKNKIWVFIDGDGNEKNESKELENIKSFHTKSAPENFIQFSEHDIECYYPDCFSDRILEINNTSKKEDKKKLKEKLSIDFNQWLVDNPSLAKDQLSIVAQELIGILETISTKLKRI